MTKRVFTVETVGLRIERREGWLRGVFDVLEGLGYCVDRFVLHGRPARGSTGAHDMNIQLTVRTAEARPNIDALLLTLKALPGVRRCRGSASPRKPQASNVGRVPAQDLGEKPLHPAQDVPVSEMFS